MKNEIYTPMEKNLIQGALYLEALETKKKTTAALELDLMLLELEAKADMMDGMNMQEWLL